MLDPDIHLFLDIVAAGSLSAAGRSRALSAPMVSRRLMRLEQHLGTTLLRRTTRRLELTVKGAAFHADMLQLAGEAEAAQARLGGDDRRPHGPMRIAAPTSFGRLHIAPTLPAFLARFPEVELDLQLSDLYVDLLAERIDLAIRITDAVAPPFDGVRLAPNRRLLCAAPAYLATTAMPATPADLARHHLLAADGQLPWRLASPGRAYTIGGTSRVRTNSSEVVRELALAGAGIALRSLWDVSDDLAAGRLLPVLPGIEGSATNAIYAIRPRERLVSPAVRAFGEHLRGLLQPAPWEREDHVG
jgi:DNA-binding transcriptional LysR family regulator